MKNQKARNFAIVAVTAMLLAATATSITATEFAFAYSRNQATSQANACGNGQIPTNVGCQNIDCQIQGDENACALTAQQTFPEVVPPVPPVPQVDVGCPEDTVWDITIREQEEGQALPVDTIVCLFQRTW